MELNADFWNERYLNGEAAWDMGKISPPMQYLIDKLEDKNLRILIPGCGNAHEADYLLEKGFTDITLVDLAAEPVKRWQEKWKNVSAIKAIQGDFFALEGEYDIILEQTLFCAISPSLRTQYAAKVKKLLSPKGQLLGVLFSVEFPHEGPPFGGTVEEYQTIFSPLLNAKFEKCEYSHPKRQGNECFIFAKHHNF